MAVLGVHAEFWAGSTCPPQETVDQLAESLREMFLPGVEQGRRALAACARRNDRAIIVLGVWFDASGELDDELMRGLAASPLLLSTNSAAIRVTKQALQLAADEFRTEFEKDHQGKVHLESIAVEIRDAQVVTRITGSYDLPVGPNPDFTHTIRDRLALAPQGGEEALTFEQSTDTDMDAGMALIVSGLIAATVSPLLGAALIGTALLADAIAEGKAPNSPGIGANVAVGWPTGVLTPKSPQSPTGKFAFVWSDLKVTEDGIVTEGIFLPANREPRIAISGRERVSIDEALGHATARYIPIPRDLRSPRVTWSGNGEVQDDGSLRVTFVRPGTVTLQISAIDDDGLTATASKDVQVSVIPLEPDQQPF